MSNSSDSKLEKKSSNLPHTPREFITISAIEGDKQPFVSVEAQINPKELSFSKSVKYSMAGAKDRNIPKAEYTGGDAISISLDLLFDFYEEGGDVRVETNKLLYFTMRDAKLLRPPKVELIWGGPIFNGGFRGVVDSLKIRYTMFSVRGVPCRAVATVGLKQATDDAVKSSNSPDVAKRRVVKRGETLALIAQAEYNDASQWRRIADTNNINNPLELKPGTPLLIPPILA